MKVYGYKVRIKSMSSGRPESSFGQWRFFIDWGLLLEHLQTQYAVSEVEIKKIELKENE